MLALRVVWADDTFQCVTTPLECTGFAASFCCLFTKRPPYPPTLPLQVCKYSCSLCFLTRRSYAFIISILSLLNCRIWAGYVPSRLLGDMFYLPRPWHTIHWNVPFPLCSIPFAMSTFCCITCVLFLSPVCRCFFLFVLVVPYFLRLQFLVLCFCIFAILI